MTRAEFVLFTGPERVEWTTRDLPDPGEGQVLLRATRTVISTGTELAGLTGPPWLRTDGSGMDPVYPHQPGYCFCGIVEAVGSNVDWPHVGLRVSTAAPHGTHALVAASRCHAVPAGLADEAAALIGGLGATVLNGVRIGRPALGEDIVVFGQGLIGQMGAHLLAKTGLNSLVAVDISERRLAMARALGAATHFVNPSSENMDEVVSRLTDGRGADTVYEATGRGESFDVCIRMIRRFGTVVALGSPRWPAPVNLFHLHEKGLRIVGAHVSTHPRQGDERDRWSQRAHIDLLSRWGADRRCDFGALIQRSEPRAKAAQVYADLVAERDRFLGVALRW